MRTQDLIAAKRDGLELAENDVARLVLDYAADRIPDYQMSAFLMAVCIRGMSQAETLAMTRAMVESGVVLDLSPIPGAKADKHSTGGVGDKTTLIVVPILASLGLKLAKMSGRGLGFTGGTLDKLESIPGLTTSFTAQRLVEQVRSVGAAFAGQTAELVPADKKIYALRDVTGTVDSIPLIAASVMSKKIACGSDVILLDVKVGSGAFMRDIQQARELSRTMVTIGDGFGRSVAAAITDMSQPLGCAVGNALEVAEAIESLKGGGPPDLRELCVELSAILLNMSGLQPSLDAGREAAAAALDDGSALAKFTEIISAQGGDPRIVEDPARLPRALHVVPVPSASSGCVSAIDAAKVGTASMVLRAGRESKDDSIDPAAGILVHKKLGDRVSAGEPLALIHTKDPDLVPPAAELVVEAYEIAEGRPVPNLVHEVVTGTKTYPGPSIDRGERKGGERRRR